MGDIKCKIVKMVAVFCLFFDFTAGMNAPLLPLGREISASKSALIQKHQQELEKSIVYILVTEWYQGCFAKNLKETMEMSIGTLRAAGVKFYITVTCDGVRKDRDQCLEAFNSFPYGYTISLQKKNLGCSMTRWNQLQFTYDAMLEDQENGLHPYFFIFDGDDMMSKDLILLELLSIYETGAQAAGPNSSLRCYAKDAPGVLKSAAQDIQDFSIQVSSLSEFAYGLFKFEVLNNLWPDFQKYQYAFNTLRGLERGFQNKTSYAVLRLLGYHESCPFDAEFFSPEHAPALFYYMQHSASLQHSPLAELSQFCAGINETSVAETYKELLKLDGKTLDHVKAEEEELLFLFGKPEVPTEYRVTGEHNSAVTKDFLLDKWSQTHKVANTIVNAFDKVGGSKDFPIYIWLTTAPQARQLLKQNLNEPLSEDFIEEFYAPVFAQIFSEAKK